LGRTAPTSIPRRCTIGRTLPLRSRLARASRERSAGETQEREPRIETGAGGIRAG
jgi:hypothetical protein